MAAKSSKPGRVSWIATRTFLVKRRDEARPTSILVGLTAPRKLKKSEYPFRTSLQLFGCTIQFGTPRGRHLGHGRDAMEALLHSLLAIDRYLSQTVKDAEVRCDDGSLYDPKFHGLLDGPIGRKYGKRNEEG
jgi:hypothetical protein